MLAKPENEAGGTLRQLCSTVRRLGKVIANAKKETYNSNT